MAPKQSKQSNDAKSSKQEAPFVPPRSLVIPVDSQEQDAEPPKTKPECESGARPAGRLKNAGAHPAGFTSDAASLPCTACTGDAVVILWRGVDRRGTRWVSWELVLRCGATLNDG